MNREDFPILTETIYGKPLVYLDNAATTQKPLAMLNALNDAYLHRNANIHRGVHHLSQLATEQHEQARKKVADFLGAASEKEIIFTKGTTDSLNILAFCFGEACVRHRFTTRTPLQYRPVANALPTQTSTPPRPAT